MRLVTWVYLFLCLMVTLHFCHQADAKDKKTFQKIYKEVKKASKKYGIPKRVILSIMEIESSFVPSSRGRSHGEVGLMQLRPDFHKCAKFDIRQNIQCGVRYLRSIVDYDDAGKLRLETIVRYNWGPSRRGINYKRTRYWGKFRDAYRNQRWRRWLDDSSTTDDIKK